MKSEYSKIIEDHKIWIESKGENGSEADLRGADLREADLRGADLDFSCWPLWCGSKNVKIDDRLAKQLVYHAVCVMAEAQKKEFLNDPIVYANQFHRVLDKSCEEVRIDE